MRLGIAVLVLGLAAASVAGCADTGSEPQGSSRVPSSEAPRAAPPRAGGTAIVPFATTGDLWVLDSDTINVLRIDPQGAISVAISHEQILALTGEETADFDDSGIAFSAAGDLYFVETDSDSVLRRTLDGELSVFVGREAILATTQFETVDPEGLAVGEDGRIYILDADAGMLLAADPVTGGLSIFATAPQIAELAKIPDIKLGSNILAGPGGVIYVTTRGLPPGILAVKPGLAVDVLASGLALGDLDGYMTLDAAGDLIVVDKDRDMIRRVATDGAMQVFLSQAQLEAVFDGEVRLTSGIAFDSAGRFYLPEDNSESIARFDTDLVGSIWLDEPAVRAVTDSDPDYANGVAFEPR